MAFLYFILILVAIILFVLIKKNMPEKESIDKLSNDVHELDNKLNFILKNMATKYDLEQMEMSKSEINTSTARAEVAKDEVLKDVPQEFAQPQEEVVPSTIVEPTSPVVQPPMVALSESKLPKHEATTPTQPMVSFAASSTSAKEPAISQPVAQPTIVPTQWNPQTQTQATAYQEEETGDERGIVEKLFGGNLFAKIGIVTLVLGIGFFVKYAIDQGWINEVARVGIGLLVGGAIIALAHKLKEKYHVFSSILVGGGISVFYITITLAFREYEIFSQPIAFALLVGVTVFSVVLSLLYNRQELAIFSLVGGVLAPLLVSTGAGNYIVLFSYMLILNTGMLIISLKKDWKIINIIAYIFSLLFFWTWLIVRFDTEFLGASIFASLFFVQFYALAIIKHLRESHKMSKMQAVLILTNNLSVLLAFMFILNDYTPDLRGIATLVLAAINAVLMMTLFRQAKVDRNMIYLIIAVVMSFVSLAIPIQLNGYVITMFWAVEMVVLLWLWQKSKIEVFNIGFLVIGMLSLISYGMDVIQFHDYGYYETEYLHAQFTNKMCVTGVVMILAFGASLFLIGRERDENGQRKQNSLVVLFRLMFLMLLFIVPFIEINYQLDVRLSTNDSSSFRYLCLATYTFIFIAVLGLVYRKKSNALVFPLLLISAGMYVLFYTFVAVDVREDVCYYDFYPRAFFAIHLLSLPAIASIIFVLAKRIKEMTATAFMVMSWVLLIISTIVLSVELDNLVIMLVGNIDNYYRVLEDVQTFGYPILWGLIAMVLMIWGLKGKEVVLRKISLISFALIVVKFYAYDVWLMSQVGKIISFVVLGIILLTASFMQQKLKDLVKTEDEENKKLDNNQE